MKEPFVKRAQKDESGKKSWIALMLFLGVFTCVQIFDLYKDGKAATWPSVMGSIHSNIYPNSLTGPKSGPVFVPKYRKVVEFSYRADRIEYRSSNLSFGLTFSDAYGYKDKEQVWVYFNPHDPREAVLRPGPKLMNVIAMGVGSLYWITKQIRRE